MRKIYLDLGTPNLDPVKHCEVYRKIGCSHIDGYLCNYPDCDILGAYVDKMVDLAVESGFFEDAEKGLM